MNGAPAGRTGDRQPWQGMSADLAAVCEIAAAAGVELSRLYRQAPEALRTERKGPRDLVTAADHAAERVILEALAQRFPGDAMLAEESGAHGAPGERRWLIDPLDGTSNFAAGHPMFAVSVALWDADVARLAVVHAPALGETFCAEAGRGAFRNGERVRVAADADLASVLLATGFSYARAELGEGAMGRFERLLGRSRDIRRGGCASLDLAFTACGIFGGFWEYHLEPHDVAAGALLVTEAGGRVTDVAGGGDFLFGRSIVAGAPAIHAELLQELAGGPRHPGSEA